jgi:hypothetical protein
MAAYVIANVNVQDAATFEEYRPACLVVLEFPRWSRRAVGTTLMSIASRRRYA